MARSVAVRFDKHAPCHPAHVTRASGSHSRLSFSPLAPFSCLSYQFGSRFSFFARKAGIMRSRPLDCPKDSHSDGLVLFLADAVLPFPRFIRARIEHTFFRTVHHFGLISVAIYRWFTDTGASYSSPAPETAYTHAVLVCRAPRNPVSHLCGSMPFSTVFIGSCRLPRLMTFPFLTLLTSVSLCFRCARLSLSFWA